MNITILILGVLIVLGSIDVMRLMNKGDRPCRVLKYVLAALSGFALSWYAAHGIGNTMHLLGAITLLLFIWPKIHHQIVDYLQMYQPRIYLYYLMYFDAKECKKQ